MRPNRPILRLLHRPRHILVPHPLLPRQNLPVKTPAFGVKQPVFLGANPVVGVPLVPQVGLPGAGRSHFQYKIGRLANLGKRQAVAVPVLGKIGAEYHKEIRRQGPAAVVLIPVKNENIAAQHHIGTVVKVSVESGKHFAEQPLPFRCIGHGFILIRVAFRRAATRFLQVPADG